MMRPDVQTNVYAELAKIKSIKPVDHAFNILKWHSAMESKQISIKQKVPGVYHESQFIMDYLDAFLIVEVKIFKAKVNILCNRYLCRNPDRWNALYIGGEIIKTYNNMFEDGTWKCEIGKKDQNIALTTKLSEMQSKFDQQAASFVTQTNKEITPTPASNQDRGLYCPKRAPYTVAAWRLVKKEDNIIVNGRDFHWCTSNHYSGGVKHNRMYANHKSSDHGAWCKSFDKCKSKSEFWENVQ